MNWLLIAAFAPIAFVSQAQERDCEALTQQMTSATEDAREKATRKFEACWGRKRLDEPLAGHVRKSILMGNTAAASLLLLGTAPDEESKALLKERQSNPRRMLKWDHNTQPVSEGLVAATARLQFALEEAKPAVLRALEKSAVADARFFLDAIDYIDDKEVLVRVAALLSDTRAVPNEFRRRLCDYAVPRVGRRLKLKPSFEPRDYGRFSAAQLEEVRKLASAALDR